MIKFRPGQMNFGVYAMGLFAAISATLVVVLSLSQPSIGVRLVAEGDAVVVGAVTPDGPGAALMPGDRVLSIRPADTEGAEIALTATDLIEEPDGLPMISDMRAFFRRQGELNAMFESGPVILQTDRVQEGIELTARPTRPVSDMPFTFWMQLTVGLVSCLLGAWVLSVRREEAGARYLALSGFGLMISSHAAALYSSRALPMPEFVIAWASSVNSLGALAFGIGMVNLFLTYPAKYLPRWVPTLVSVIFGIWALASFLRLTVTSAMAIHIPTVVLMTGILLGVIGQIFATRGKPLQRAALRWFGLSVTLGAGGFVSLIALPQAFGLQPQISQSYAFSLFLLVYVGLVLGVARYRLFDLEFWAFRALFYGGGVALLLILDAVLVYSVSLERMPALSISLLVVALVYLPARDLLARWLGGQRTMTTSELFDMLSGFALANDPEKQKAQFRALLSRLFNPIHIEDAPTQVETPRLLQNGGAMDVPGLDGLSALRMSWPHNGRRLFSARDLDRVRDVLRLGAQFIERRHAFEYGVMQERQRINRDMHDNVGVQLLGALHSSDDGRKNALIRQALTDLREMVSNTFGGPSGLSALMADLRAEMSEYLAAADIRLDWDDRAVPDITVASPVVNAIRATLREGIGNILRHSGASVARVTLAADATSPQWLRLEISDDGRGLGQSLNAARIKGNGLRNLTSRSEAWGGTFSLTDGPGGQGTRLKITVPLTQGSEGVRPLSEAGE